MTWLKEAQAEVAADHVAGPGDATEAAEGREIAGHQPSPRPRKVSKRKEVVANGKHKRQCTSNGNS